MCFARVNHPNAKQGEKNGQRADADETKIGLGHCTASHPDDQRRGGRQHAAQQQQPPRFCRSHPTHSRPKLG
ncbi:hypothetical protein VTH06DRAFT_4688 [Thermothelomyces fergusii]